MERLIRVENVSQVYQAENGEVKALDGICFFVSKGEFVSIVGPSGCGKSTLLSIIAGEIAPTSGQVLIGETPVTSISNRVGYMLQKDHLLPWRNIWKNTLLGLEIRGRLTEENRKYTLSLLEKYGLWDFRESYPDQLSGGMRQRAALIRTLAVQPDVFLLDEAFSALDYQTRLAVTDDVYRILKQEEKTALMVTHNISEAISMSDRVVVLSKRPAHVVTVLQTAFPQGMLPLERRNHPAFSEYFNTIWKELDVHV